MTVADLHEGLEVLRRAGFVCWGDGPKIVVDTANGAVAGRRGGSEVAKALADAGVYPSDLRRAPPWRSPTRT